jgi:hypothetical protein
MESSHQSADSVKMTRQTSNYAKCQATTNSQDELILEMKTS